MTPEGRAQEPREVQSATIALARATLLISKPSAVAQRNGESRLSADAVRCRPLTPRPPKPPPRRSYSNTAVDCLVAKRA